MQRRKAYRPAAILNRKRLGESLTDRVGLRLATDQRYARIQPTYHAQPTVPAPGNPAAKKRILDHRNPDLLVVSEYRDTEIGGHDADNGERPLVQRYGTADQVLGSAEPGTPQTFADNDHRSRALLFIVGKQITSRKRPHAEKRKDFRRHHHGGDHRGVAPPG